MKHNKTHFYLYITKKNNVISKFIPVFFPYQKI